MTHGALLKLGEIHGNPMNINKLVGEKSFTAPEFSAANIETGLTGRGNSNL